jgi:hypothetical protein
MEDERRKARRVDVDLPTTWEGVLQRVDATVSSLSLNGCFVLSGGRVEPNELLLLEIHLPEDRPVYVWVEVTDHAYEIGFAARFTSLEDDEDQTRLVDFITKALQDSD